MMRTASFRVVQNPVERLVPFINTHRDGDAQTLALSPQIGHDEFAESGEKGAHSSTIGTR